MVISPKTNGIIYVILGDTDKYLPDNLNEKSVLVFRKDKSTNNVLTTVKPIGQLAGPELLKQEEVAPVCNYIGDGNPLHQHSDGSYWHFDVDFTLEHGPFATYEEAYGSLENYCENIQTAKEFLTTVEKFVSMVSDEDLKQIVEQAETHEN